MRSPKPVTIFIALLAFAPAALAAAPGDWRGQDNEFGSIRTPYAADMDGERVPVEAKVVLRHNYQDKDGRFFMFAFDVRNTPLDVSLDNLIRSDNGNEMPCYRREPETNGQFKCFVDLVDMPAPGTEIMMRGTVGSSRLGGFQVGAMLIPFTYKWEKVPMSNGLDAELYGSTSLNVKTATSGSGSAQLGGMGTKIPAPGAVGLIAAVGIAAALVVLRRRE